jgi:predicted O-linked N-acetylglucosamine transferase (SPINDLY family)
MSDWIAADRDDYVALAVAKARDLDALAGLRGTLRERVRNSPVMDEPGFVRRFESACLALLRNAGGAGRE